MTITLIITAAVLALASLTLATLLFRAKVEQTRLRGLLEQSEQGRHSLEEQHQRELVAQANQHLAEQQLALAARQEQSEREKNKLKIEIERLRAALSSEEMLRRQFREISGNALEAQGANLREQQRLSLEPLLTPLRDKLKELDQSVRDESKQRTESKAVLETLIKNLMERAEGIGADARNLTLALKGESKTQGNWGEMILETMLEKVGFRKGEEYFLQELARSEEGKRLHPDVIVRLPGKRCIIIDSKVSLTAYARAMESEDEDARNAALQEHVASVRAHVAELAEKEYQRAVEGSLSYVLMFIPNEASYIAAVQQTPSLPEEACRKGILIVSPTNLLMALQLAHHMWAREKQSQNVQEIIRKATSVYEKLFNFARSFEDVGDKLNKALAAFDNSNKQLRTGRGNAFKQLEDLRQMGLSPKNVLEYDDSAELLPTPEAEENAEA